MDMNGPGAEGAYEHGEVGGDDKAKYHRHHPDVPNMVVAGEGWSEQAEDVQDAAQSRAVEGYNV